MRNYDKSYMKMAQVWAENSYAIRHKVGALVVKDNRIISDGYNGTPSGFDNTCEYVSACHLPFRCDQWMESLGRCDCVGCPNRAELTTKNEVLHAEANAITKLSKGTESAEGATLYVTLSPCFNCAKLIIQAGITRVVYGEEYNNPEGIDLLRKCGVTVDFLDIMTL